MAPPSGVSCIRILSQPHGENSKQESRQAEQDKALREFPEYELAD